MDGTREEWSILRYSPSPSVCTDGDSVGREFVTKSGSLHVQGDSGLTCLKLGKRQYFVEGTMMKREKLNVGNNGGSSSSPVSVVPRCQVEGCHVELKVAKEYHKRHKVCEMHSKSPKVVVLGLEQRFCQQCSRFHVVSEFDDAKRSCRRRLAGHNERRRKNTNDSLIKSSSQENGIISNRFPCDTSGRALSLLSSKNPTSVLPAADLSSRSSAALRELIAENRAAILAMQLFSDRNLAQQHTLEESSTSSMVSYGYASHHRNLLNPAAGMEPRFDRFNESGNSSHVTLDLMQTPTSSFGILPGRNKSKDDNDCSGIWNSLEGSQMV